MLRLYFPEENYLIVTLITCAPDTTQSTGAEASFTADSPIPTMSWPLVGDCNFAT